MSSTSNHDIQAENIISVPDRRQDYKEDLQNGVSFDMVPALLTKAYLEKNFPEPKYRLIMLMIHHSKKYKLWRTTLEKSVSKASLKKYLPELISEGYIEVEQVVTSKGGKPHNVYHVNSVWKWKIFLDDQLVRDNNQHVTLNGAPVNGSPINGSPTIDITRRDSNQTNDNYYLAEGCEKSSHLINDILNIDRYPSTRTLFEGLTDIQKEKVFLVLKENSSRYDYDSMSDKQLVDLLKQVLAEGDSGNRPHVLNKELPLKDDSKGLNKGSAPAPKKPLGARLDGVRGPRAMFHAKLRKGGIPYNGPDELNSACDELVKMHRTYGEHVENWIQAVLDRNSNMNNKTNKRSISDLWHTPETTFETYMKGLK